MTMPQDLSEFVENLSEFRDTLSSKLIQATYLSNDVAAPLWQARTLIGQALDELVKRYGSPRVNE